MKSKRETRRREVNILLRAAAAGDRSPELMSDIRAAYFEAGRGEKTKIARRLSLAGLPAALIEDIKEP